VSTQCNAPAVDKGYPSRASTISIHTLQASTQCNASAVDNGYPIREPIVPSIGKRRLDLPVQKNILTNYFCILSTDQILFIKLCLI
jgi:hypothetical protein